MDARRIRDLRAARLRKNLSVEDVAVGMALAPPTIRAIEAGELEAMPELLDQWSDVIRKARDKRGWLERLVDWMARARPVVIF